MGWKAAGKAARPCHAAMPAHARRSSLIQNDDRAMPVRPARRRDICNDGAMYWQWQHNGERSLKRSTTGGRESERDTRHDTPMYICTE